ncbi:hypothetical protein [Streptomyces violascens]|uniref:hypothetical protein n=1 Tax=Streptomyces violascens TaxID=67381 RepID=UPI0036C64713
MTAALLRFLRRPARRAALAAHHLITGSAVLIALASAAAVALMARQWAYAAPLTAAVLALIAVGIRAENAAADFAADCPLCTIARRRAPREESTK